MVIWKIRKHIQKISIKKMFDYFFRYIYLEIFIAKEIWNRFSKLQKSFQLKRLWKLELEHFLTEITSQYFS